LHKSRPGDQPFYVTDFAKLTKHTGWQPSISVSQNIEMIWKWWREQRAENIVMPFSTRRQAALIQVPEAAS
jgi:CDP-paratose 2-epimerase